MPGPPRRRSLGKRSLHVTQETTLHGNPAWPFHPWWVDIVWMQRYVQSPLCHQLQRPSWCGSNVTCPGWASSLGSSRAAIGSGRRSGAHSRDCAAPADSDRNAGRQGENPLCCPQPLHLPRPAQQQAPSIGLGAISPSLLFTSVSPAHTVVLHVSPGCTPLPFYLDARPCLSTWMPMAVRTECPCPALWDLGMCPFVRTLCVG